MNRIQADPALSSAFNTLLQQYARFFGEQNFRPTQNATDNFFAALDISGVPASEVGHSTAWNDILNFAVKQQEVQQGEAKKPYEGLVLAIDAVKTKPPRPNDDAPVEFAKK